MNKHQVKGMSNRVTGEVKQQVGKMTGDSSLQAKGHAREAKGKLQQGLGDAKEAVRDADREASQRDMEKASRSGRR
jgi:uncharacterized protein YjbJ (UPF0337 family)